MARLSEALADAAALSDADDAALNASCASLMSKVKRGLFEVKKKPELLATASPDAAVWVFLLRVAVGNPPLLKQVWDTAAVLLRGEEWTTLFSGIEGKARLNLGTASDRDVPAAADLVAQIVGASAAELEDLLPLEVINVAEPDLCKTILERLEASELPAAARDAALSSSAARSMQARIASVGEEDEGEKRRVVGGAGKSSFGKGADIPVYVCEGISGSHQKMEIKKGL